MLARADVVTDWVSVLLDAVRTARSTPPQASRIMAITFCAVFDAVNSIDGRYEPYSVVVPAAPDASREAAAAVAAHDVLQSLYALSPQSATLSQRFAMALDRQLADMEPGPPVDNGRSVGAAVAPALLAERAKDGATTVVEFVPSEEIGRWRPLSGQAALLPQWPYVRPFGIRHGAQFRHPGPPPLTSEEYAEAYNEVKALGAASGSVRTAEQSEIALFWADNPGTETPPGHWLHIAQQLSLDRGSSLEENARLFALVSMALSDAAIVAWDHKYAYDLWRPISAIREADADGNPNTLSDPTWSSFIPTPPFSEYTSGHSTFSGAASTILARFFGSDVIGTDDEPFRIGSDGLPGVYRSFTTLSQAAEEAGRSRIYGGIHFEFSNRDALKNGRELAAHIYERQIRLRGDTDHDGNVDGHDLLTLHWNWKRSR